MSYRRARLVRRSRRDRLPIPKSVLTVVSLVGAVLSGVAAAGRLPVFGVRFPPGVAPWLIASVAFRALGVVLRSATLAALADIAASPAQPLRGNQVTAEPGGSLDG